MPQRKLRISLLITKILKARLNFGRHSFVKATDMHNNNKILQELQEFAPLLTQTENKPPYTVSLTYFDSFSGTIMEKIKSEVEIKYYLSRDMPFSIPDYYFQNFSSRVLQIIRGKKTENAVFDELEEISPLLNTISKQHTYDVPAKYFETKQWKKNVYTDQRAKVISFTSLKRIAGLLAAAVIIGLLAVGIFIFTGKEDSNSKAYHVKIIPEVNKLSEQEIVDFLKTTSSTDNIVSTKNIQPQKIKDIKSAVSKMSDEEIQGFLQENGVKDEM
jgi:hypothetical protein